MAGKALAAEVGFLEAVVLDHGPHGAVQNQDALAQQLAQCARHRGCHAVTWGSRERGEGLDGVLTAPRSPQQPLPVNEIPGRQKGLRGRGFLATCLTWPQYAANRHEVSYVYQSIQEPTWGQTGRQPTGAAWRHGGGPTPSRSSTVCRSTPAISIRLRRAVAPVSRRTAARGSFSRSAMKRSRASLAALSVGGAPTRMRIASPYQPMTSVRPARGCTCTTMLVFIAERTAAGSLAASYHPHHPAHHDADREPGDQRRDVEHPQGRDDPTQRLDDPVGDHVGRPDPSVVPARPEPGCHHPDQERDQHP